MRVVFDTRTLNGLSVFIAVVDTGSYVRAGEVIGMTKSGVSRTISRLEERTGLRLFDRNSRSLKLTDEGRLFYDEMSPLLAQIASIAGNRSERSASVRGKL